MISTSLETRPRLRRGLGAKKWGTGVGMDAAFTAKEDESSHGMKPLADVWGAHSAGGAPTC